MPRIFLVSVLTSIVFTLPAFADDTQNAAKTKIDLDVVVDGVSGSSGNVRLAVYSEADVALFPDQLPPLKQFAAAAGQAITFHFDSLAPGRYAALAFHDENSNEILDRNFIGIPKEHWGVSGTRPFGRNPRFAESVFVLDVQHRKIAINLE